LIEPDPDNIDQNETSAANNNAVHNQWSSTEGKMLSLRSRAVPDAMPKTRAPAIMKQY
jgi:hypothetical protein